MPIRRNGLTGVRACVPAKLRKAKGLGSKSAGCPGHTLGKLDSLPLIWGKCVPVKTIEAVVIFEAAVQAPKLGLFNGLKRLSGCWYYHI